MGNFKDLGVNKGLLKSIEELGFTSPTPVQEQAIPHLLKDKTDLIA
ncbi:MAG: DEAD/DEAH box helicase, partial [Flavobacteriaceae bacterium]|nr:DEAD/DEAH box helicase [Flavobacteriaceae bacterium]